MNKKIIAAAVAALALPAAASAMENANLSYTFAEFGYQDIEEADGFNLEGSYQFNQTFFAFGEYNTLGNDGSDVTTLTFGAGAAVAMNDKVDLFAKLGFVSADIEVGPFSNDDTGFGLEFGARGMVTKELEVFGGLSYVDVFEDSRTGLELGARYWVQENLGISFAYEDVEDGSGFMLAGRYTF